MFCLRVKFHAGHHSLEVPERTHNKQCISRQQGEIHVLDRCRWTVEVFLLIRKLTAMHIFRRIVKGRRLNPAGRSAAASARGETMQRLFSGVLAHSVLRLERQRNAP